MISRATDNMLPTFLGRVYSWALGPVDVRRSKNVSLRSLLALMLEDTAEVVGFDLQLQLA